MNGRGQVEKMVEGWKGAYNKRDARALAALYSEDAYFSSPRTQPLIGRAAIEEHFAQLVMRDLKVEEITISHCREQGGNMVAVGTYRFKGPAGEVAGHWGAAYRGDGSCVLHVSNIPAAPIQ